MTLPRFLLLLNLLLAGNLSAQSAAPVTLPPPEAFWNTVGISLPTLSPDGRHLAYRTDVQGKLLVVVLDLTTGQATGLASAEGVDRLIWKGNESILCASTFSARSINIRTHAIVDLLAELSKKALGFPSIFDPLPLDPQHIIFSGREGEYLYDIFSGKAQALHASTDSFARQYIVDQDGVARVRQLRKDNELQLQWRPSVKADFVTLKRWSLPAFAWGPLGLLPDGPDQLLVSCYDEKDLGELRILDLKTAATRPFDQPLERELRGVIFDPISRNVLGIAVHDAGIFVRWLDPTMAKLQKSLDASFPSKRVSIQGFSDDRQMMLLSLSANNEPTTWCVLDRNKNSLKTLNQTPLPLPPERMAETKAVEIKTRDGLIMHGFLTRPVQAGSTPCPLVLCPYDFPFNGRYLDGYTPQAQFLTSRGYATLALNYRGTEGYGAAYMTAGRGEIAGRIIDDINDAAKWAVDSGITRRGQICIWGHDLAGGMAVVAATDEPDLYGAIVCHDAVTAWRAYSERWQSSPFRAWFEISTAAVFNRSPLACAKKLSVPVLVIHDSVVSENDEFEKKLKSLGKTVSYAEVYHGELKPFAFIHTQARSMEAFLSKYVPSSSAGLR